MASVGLLALLLLAAAAAAAFWPGLYAATFRQLFRAYPEARDAFVGRGSWISFSRKFGRAYALGSLVLAATWILGGAALLPDTPVDAWLIFAPAILLIAVGVSLLALVVCRWIVDE